jgi:hypothetical protein
VIPSVHRFDRGGCTMKKLIVVLVILTAISMNAFALVIACW